MTLNPADPAFVEHLRSLLPGINSIEFLLNQLTAFQQGRFTFGLDRQ